MTLSFCPLPYKGICHRMAPMIGGTTKNLELVVTQEPGDSILVLGFYNLIFPYYTVTTPIMMHCKYSHQGKPTHYLIHL